MYALNPIHYISFKSKLDHLLELMVRPMACHMLFLTVQIIMTKQFPEVNSLFINNILNKKPPSQFMVMVIILEIGCML